MVVTYLFWVAQSHHISLMGLAKLHKNSLVAKGRNIHNLSHNVRNIPDLDRNGSNLSPRPRPGNEKL